MARGKKSDGINFKQHTFKILDGNISIWVKVSDQGKFYFELPYRIAEALGLDLREKHEGKDAEDAGHKLHRIMRQFKELHTAHSYHIRYRMAFSNYIKYKMPDSLLNNENWGKVKRLGGEYFPDDSLSLIMYWYPVERTVHGERVSETKLKPAEEDGIKRAEEEKGDEGFWAGRLHKPYEGIILVADNTHWNDDSEVWFEVDLTKETYEFFQLFEDSLIKMISGIFRFLDKDKDQLLADIQKSMLSVAQGKGFKLLG